MSLLGRAFGVSVSIPALILATAALTVVPLGWYLGGMMFANTAQLKDEVNVKSDMQFPRAYSGKKKSADAALWSAPWNGITRNLETERGTISNVYTELVEPAKKFFDREASWNELALYTFGGLWTLLVYALFGGAISRIAVVQLGRGERVSLGESLRFSIRKLRSYFMAPLFVIIASILLAMLITIPSLLIRAGGWGSVVVGVVWVIVLILAAAMAILLIILSFGWPLMWGAISAEETGDVFEATSRSFSYTIQRPLKYACYVIVALILGGLGWWLVDLVTRQVVELALWSASWGGGTERVDMLRQLIFNPAAEHEFGSTFQAGAMIIFFFSQIVLFLAVAYTFSYFWAGFAAIYLLLRKDTDQTELDDVYMPSEEAQFEMPQLHQPAEPDNTAEDAAPDAGEAGGEADAGEDDGAGDDAGEDGGEDGGEDD
jgi:hypothetical protein